MLWINFWNDYEAQDPSVQLNYINTDKTVQTANLNNKPNLTNGIA